MLTLHKVCQEIDYAAEYVWFTSVQKHYSNTELGVAELRKDVA